MKDIQSTNKKFQNNLIGLQTFYTNLAPKSGENLTFNWYLVLQSIFFDFPFLGCVEALNTKLG